MSGWDVMAEPFLTAARLGLILFALLRVRAALTRTRRGRARVLAFTGRRGTGARGAGAAKVTDTSIVSAYNDALLSGWPAGELATFDEVAGRVGTSAEHVRTVIARHWAA
ncbi:MAG: hypothetical protein IT196_11400 [Acidimicrobiales bacterium]|nr:hypothetical protein [Acidimicrobiales bacterium]